MTQGGDALCRGGLRGGGGGRVRGIGKKYYV